MQYETYKMKINLNKMDYKQNVESKFNPLLYQYIYSVIGDNPSYANIVVT